MRAPDVVPAELVLVRHGETVGQSSIRLHGRNDVELSELGRKQMSAVGSRLADRAFDLVLTSPLRRSREAADLVCGTRGPAKVIVHDFREVDFGHWEGLTLAEAAARDPELFADFSTASQDFRYPGGEHRRELSERVRSATRLHVAGAPGSTLAVLHKGIIKHVIGELLGWSADRLRTLAVELGSIHHLRRESDRWHAMVLDQTDHLAGTESD